MRQVWIWPMDGVRMHTLDVAASEGG